MTEQEQKQIIADNLNRLSEGIEQKKIADALGVNRPTLNQWYKGKATPSLVMIRRLADFFGVDLLDIINEGQILPREESDNITLLFKAAPEYKQKAIMDLLRG